MEIISDYIIKIIPLFIALYFYLLPEVLIKKSVKETIKDIKKTINGPENKDKAEVSIYGIAGLISFLGFFGGTTGYIISFFSDGKSSKFLIFIAICLFCSLYFPIQYFQKSFVLEKKLKYFEWLTVSIITFLLILNNFL